MIVVKKKKKLSFTTVCELIPDGGALSHHYTDSQSQV